MHDVALPADIGTLNVGEICAGVGMLGEGLRAGLDYMGVEARTVFYVEREAHAAAVLASRCEDGSLDDAPIWSDLLTFNGRRFRGLVDCIAAGFPCQDLSLAGRRAGLDGGRSGLFFDILDIADACGAWCLFLENVSAIATAIASAVDEAEGDVYERAASRVLGELADRGWHAEWLTIPAAEVGASHGRERWFCFAWRVDLADTARDGERRLDGKGGRGRRIRKAGSELGHAHGQRKREPDHPGGSDAWGAIERPGARPRAGGAGGRLADPASIGRDEGWSEHAGQQGRPDAAVDGCALADAGREARGHREPRADRHEAQALGSWHAAATDGGDVLADAGHGPRAHEQEPVTGCVDAPELCIGSSPMADADVRRCGECRWCRLDRSGQSPCDAVVDDGVADTGEPGLSDAEHEEWPGARPGDEGRATAELCSSPFLFAPGPADPRWPDILEGAPFLAPALEPDFRGVVDGVAFDMGDSRAARLKCVGNGVVPAQAGVAFVELLRRAREGVE